MDRMSWNSNFGVEEDYKNSHSKKYMTNSNLFNQKPIFVGN